MDLDLLDLEVQQSENEEDVDDAGLENAENNEEENDNAENDSRTANVETEAERIKPKRVVKNPLPKLDAQRLMGPRGVVALQKTFKDVKLKGKNHEKEDLDLIMKKLEYWSHRLFPKLSFDDNIKQIEKLGFQKPVQNLMKRIRLDMFQPDEFPTDQNEKNDDPPPESVDIFDQLISTPMDNHNDDLTRDNAVLSQRTNVVSSATSTLTDEQRERIARNRRLALERRKGRDLNKNVKQPFENNSSENFSNSEKTSSDSKSTFSEWDLDSDTICLQNSPISEKFASMDFRDSQVDISNSSKKRKKILDEKIVDHSEHFRSLPENSAKSQFENEVSRNENSNNNDIRENAENLAVNLEDVEILDPAKNIETFVTNNRRVGTQDLPEKSENSDTAENHEEIMDVDDIINSLN